MSTQEFDRFLADGSTNASLASEYKALEPTVEAVLAFLTSKGYDVTEADLADVKARAAKSSSGELSDDELGNVSGGTGGYYDPSTAPGAWSPGGGGNGLESVVIW